MSRKFCPPLLLVFVAVDVVVVIAIEATLFAGESFVTPPAGTVRFEILPPPPPDSSWTITIPVSPPNCCCWTIWSALTVVGIMDNIVPSVLRVQSFGDSNGIMVTVLSTSRISGGDEEEDDECEFARMVVFSLGTATLRWFWEFLPHTHRTETRPVDLLNSQFPVEE